MVHYKLPKVQSAIRKTCACFGGLSPPRMGGGTVPTTHGGLSPRQYFGRKNLSLFSNVGNGIMCSFAESVYHVQKGERDYERVAFRMTANLVIRQEPGDSSRECGKDFHRGVVKTCMIRL